MLLALASELCLTEYLGHTLLDHGGFQRFFGDLWGKIDPFEKMETIPERESTGWNLCPVKFPTQFF
jgi:hypothetical protein